MWICDTINFSFALHAIASASYFRSDLCFNSGYAAQWANARKEKETWRVRGRKEIESRRDRMRATGLEKEYIRSGHVMPLFLRTFFYLVLVADAVETWIFSVDFFFFSVFLSSTFAWDFPFCFTCVYIKHLIDVHYVNGWSQRRNIWRLTSHDLLLFLVRFFSFGMIILFGWSLLWNVFKHAAGCTFCSRPDTW